VVGVWIEFLLGVVGIGGGRISSRPDIEGAPLWGSVRGTWFRGLIGREKVIDGDDTRGCGGRTGGVGMPCSSMRWAIPSERNLPPLSIKSLISLSDHFDRLSSWIMS
jgi:hypothetical protein